jgi:cbb3-type cytochrome oxidase maturation protein
MDVLYILIPLALLFVGAALAAFIWAVNDGQFDDTEGPAVRMLMDDESSSDRTTDDPHAPSDSTSPAEDAPSDLKSDDRQS